MTTKAKKPAKAATSTLPAIKPFIITRTFDAPRERVVAAWTNADQLPHWWGPKGARATVKALDVRAGGRLHYSLRMPDDSALWGKWAFTEVALPDRLVYLSSFSDENFGTTRHPMAPVWPLEILTTVTFTEKDGRTTQIVRWEPVNASAEEIEAFNGMHASMEGGWGGSFEELTTHLARMAPRPQAITPYLTQPDAAKAIDWYKVVFGAVERTRMLHKDGKRLMHCDLVINGGTILMSDEFGEHDDALSPQRGAKSPVSIALQLALPADVDTTFKTALEHGGTKLMAPEDTFWGARFVMFTDPFGHRWMLNADKPKA